MDDAAARIGGNGAGHPAGTVADTAATGARSLTAAPGIDDEAPVAPSRVHVAFLLGWSVAELTGRIHVSAVTGAPPDTTPVTDAPLDTSWLASTTSDTYWLLSMWRVNFDRMTQLTSQMFPKSSTLNTRWDPGQGQPPYLYPTKPADDPLFVDYADIGSVRGPDGSDILPAFRLHDAARRALNSLSLLKLTVQDSLLPQILTQQQQQLVKAALGVPPPPDDPITGEPNPPDSDHVNQTADKITKQLLLFLHAWEGYLRESFYSVGASVRNETELIAFEAGRSMAALSWNITVQVMAGKPPADIWQAAFSDKMVSPLQHQIAVLGAAVAGDTRNASMSADWIPDAGHDDVPDAYALDVVARSLDYWQRATSWMVKENAIAEQWEKMRLALIEQTGIWQALCLGETSVTAYTSPGLIQRILQDVIASFETLATEEGLVGASKQVTDEALGLMKSASEQMTELEAEVTRMSETLARSVRAQIAGTLLGVWPILVLGLVAVMALAVFLLRFTQTGPGNGSDLTAASLAVLGGLGLWGTHTQSKAVTTAMVANPAPIQAPTPTLTPVTTAPVATGPVEAAPTSLASRLGSMLGRAGETVLDDFEKGFQQIQQDLRYLSRTVAITYPLVDYFVLDNQIANVEETYDFIELIIWDKDEQKQEVMRVAYAAFGALGSFAMAKLFTSGNAPRISQAAANTATEPERTTVSAPASTTVVATPLASTAT